MNWWEQQKIFYTAWYYMIATFLSLVFVAVCVGLFMIPVLLTVIFNCPILLFLYFIILPLRVGLQGKLIDFLS